MGNEMLAFKLKQANAKIAVAPIALGNGNRIFNAKAEIAIMAWIPIPFR